MSGLTSLPVARADGTVADLTDHRGQVLLIVNVASKCGFTPQYVELETLQRRFGSRGFSVLAFPCNQFGQQEPGDAQEIATFCSTSYDVTFPVFAKVDVNGPHAAPVFRHVTAAAPGLLGSKRIKWNFTKFLVARDGRVVDRYAPTTRPESIADRIEGLLSESVTPA